MSVDPQAQGLLDQLQSQGVPDFPELGVAGARGFVNAFIDLEGPAQDVAEVRDLSAPGPDGNSVAVRVYRPTAEDDLPVLMYFHGGGHVMGDIEVADKPCRQLANVTGCVVVSVDYRLAPEHRAPAGAEDCYAVTRWAAANGPLIGADPARLGVSGDSAGGGLAASVALMARDRGGPALDLQILIYPMADLSGSGYPSRVENAEGYLLTSRALEWFNTQLLDKAEDISNPYVSPASATDLAGLPRAVVVTAGYDPMRDEGNAYASRLSAAGVPVLHLENPSMIHGFIWMAGVVDHAGVVFDQIGAYAREHLNARAGS